MQPPQFPAGGEELRAIAVDTARRALLESGHEISDSDPLPAELVDVAEHYDVPLSVVVGYVHFRPRGQQVTAEAFARHCKAFLNASAKLHYDGSAEPDVCPQCHAYPMHRVGAFFVCAGGRCTPRVAG
jgi:hypothetical protein